MAPPVGRPPITGDIPASGAPRVTIVIPLFNGAMSIGRTLVSVQAQRYPNLAVLVLDDGSLDNGANVAAQASAETHSVRILRDSSNRGLSRTLNDSLGLADGEFLLVVHQDCQLVGADWVSRAVEAAQTLQAAAVAGEAAHIVDEMGPLERVFWVIRAHVSKIRAARPVDTRVPLFSENKCDLFRISALRSLGGFPQGYREGGEDQALAAMLQQSKLKTVYPSGLNYVIFIGDRPTFRSYLAKDVSYGRQMAQILHRIGRRALRRSDDRSLDPRLVNRVVGVGWVMLSILAIALVVALRVPGYWPIPLLPMAYRLGQLLLRATAAAPTYRLSALGILQVGVYGLVSDFAYILGLLEGLLGVGHKPRETLSEAVPRAWTPIA